MYNVPIHSYMSISDILTIWPYFRTHILSIIHDKKNFNKFGKVNERNITYKSVYVNKMHIYIMEEAPRGCYIFLKTFFLSDLGHTDANHGRKLSKG